MYIARSEMIGGLAVGVEGTTPWNISSILSSILVYTSSQEQN